MRLYDTAARRVRPVEVGPGPLTMYVCGITPYDAAHLGHASTFHVFDVITRRLRGEGRRVRTVRNVTDVDDDILRVARERSVDFRSLAASQMERFDREMSAIGILPVGDAPRATAHVPEMVEWIRRLERRQATYTVAGWVYFDTARFPGYGTLSGLDTDTMVELSRQRGADPDDGRKRHPLDFVLWQPSAPGEPSWASPWGRGRPGWHIECTTLSVDALGSPVDIHGGGDDLIFPHHESELAQAVAAGVDPFVRHWVHVAMVGYQGEKMSKSLGNLVFVRDLLAEVEPPVVRVLLCQHHYRTAWTYDAVELASAAGRYGMFRRALQRGVAIGGAEAERLRRRFLERVDDDLDLPGALDVMSETAGRMLGAPSRDHLTGDGRAPTSGSHLGGRGAGGWVDGADLLGEMLALIGAHPVPVEA